ncbi:MAG: alpha/beta hydrolase [Myxococcales bacterium]|nr:alpha/beta hydrolase [Myxococcales bacterium]
MRLPTVLPVLALAACSGRADDNQVVDPTAPGEPTTQPTTPSTAAWEPCRPLTGEMAADPECLTYDVPLRWVDEGGPTIEFTVFRYTTEGATGQVWALDGGPGGTGAGPGNAQFVTALNDLGLDVYIPSQRGTSGVDALACADAFDTAACRQELVAEWGEEGLTGFASGEAALDVQMALADADDGAPQLLFGTSYGTYLAMRILQVDDAIDGVVLDSSMTLDPDIWNAGVYTDEVVLDLFAACSADPACVDRFPVAIDEAIARIEDPSHCPAVAPSGMTRGALIGFGTQLSPVVPLALTSRLARCDSEDVQALQRLEQLLALQSGPPQTGWPMEGALNSAVYTTVVAHDFLPPMTQADYDAAVGASDELLFATTQAADQFWSMKAQFPVLPGFEADTTVPDVLPPILVLQGGVDLQTPPAWGRLAADTLGGTLVTVPEAGHGVYPQSGCAQAVTDAFLTDPGAPLELSCVEALGDPDLSEPSDPQLAGFLQFALGLSELWPVL